MGRIQNHEWLKAQHSPFGWRCRVAFYEAVFTICRWPIFRVIARWSS